MKPPNILLIISDEHNARVMGCAGADFARTPHLDQLARGGTTFDAAYCPYALCTPSRNALMAGLQCHKIRAYDIGSPLASDLPTWAHMLARAGYRTPLYGKMHFLGADQLHGFDEHRHEPPCQIDGFRWGEETGNGTGYRCFTPVYFTDECRPDAIFGNYIHDREMLASSKEFLEYGSRRDQPFCLTVGFNFPHYPMVVDRAIFESYSDVPVPPPLRGRLHPRNERFGNAVWGYHRMTEAEIRASRQAYLAMVTMLDQYVGQLLSALQATGQAENTLVIYTSDHGEMWGEHGMWGKNTFYEESARVPLIVAGPGIPAGRRIATPVSLLDLYPTFRDVAGAHDWSVPLDGQSLWPGLRGLADLPARPVFCEYYGPDVKGPERMVRWHQYKLNYYHNWGLELFDLADDPREQVNRASDANYQAILDQLMTMLLRDWDVHHIDRDIRVEQNRRTLLAEGLRRTRRILSQRQEQPRT